MYYLSDKSWSNKLSSIQKLYTMPNHDWLITNHSNVSYIISEF